MIFFFVQNCWQPSIYRQDHCLHGLCIQSGPSVGVCLKSAKTGLCRPLVAAQVWGRHSSEHCPLQPEASLWLPRTHEGSVRLHQGNRSSQQMAKTLQRCALWGDGLLRPDQPVKSDPVSQKCVETRIRLTFKDDLEPDSCLRQTLLGLLKVTKWWLFEATWLQSSTDNAIWQSGLPWLSGPHNSYLSICQLSKISPLQKI